MPPPLPASGMPPPPLPKTPPMFAWWGIIPVILFIVAHVALNWETAKIRATDPSYAVSYLLGGLIGALGLAALVGWGAYRIGSRSQLAGTLALSGALLFFAMADLNTARSTKAILQPAASAPTPASFDGFAFEVPAGWSQVRPDRNQTKAMLTFGSTSPTGADGLIKIEVGKPTIPDVRKTAASLAGADGQVLPTSLTVDGVEAVRVETPSTDLNRPHHAVAAIRNGRLYLIMAAGARGTDVSAGFEHVLKTWHWRD